MRINLRGSLFSKKGRYSDDTQKTCLEKEFKTWLPFLN